MIIRQSVAGSRVVEVINIGPRLTPQSYDCSILLTPNLEKSIPVRSGRFQRRYSTIMTKREMHSRTTHTDEIQCYVMTGPSLAASAEQRVARTNLHIHIAATQG